MARAKEKERVKERVKEKEKEVSMTNGKWESFPTIVPVRMERFLGPNTTTILTRMVVSFKINDVENVCLTIY